MIICGFAGIGKTNLCNKGYTKFIDMDSSNFAKDQYEDYVDKAYKLSSAGFTVFISTHQEVRDILRREEIPFIVVIPDRDDKQEYLNRYKNRGNSQSYIDLFDKNWDKFIDGLKKENFVYTLPTNGYLEDLFITNKPTFRFEDNEYNVLQKITRITKMDCWFGINTTIINKKHYDYIYDYESRRKRSIKSALKDLYSGIEDEMFNNNLIHQLDSDELFILYFLFIRTGVIK